jgi:hypothetical protein
MKTIYISGKISGLDIYTVNQNFFMASFYVAKYKAKIINPLEIRPLFGIKKWLFYMIADIWQLRKCTHIAMQKNWIDSKGAVIEYFLAKFIFKLEIIFI